MEYCYTDSPLGTLLLAGTGEFLNFIGFSSGRGQLTPRGDWAYEEKAFVEPRQQLDEYFNGKRKVFSLSLEPSGTEFQRQTWQALLQIPYGESRSYGQLAAHIGRPKAVRAVGAANGRNPLPIVIPCHRVIGSDGSLTGYAGGLEAKKYLLNLESGGAH